MAQDVSALIDHINHDLLRINEIDDIAVNGIQVEGSKKEIRLIGTAVTASGSVIERACRDGIDLLIVHHGLFTKTSFHSITGVLYKKIKMLIENGITLAGYHLPLDSHSTLGNASSLPLDLGWKEITPFCSYKGMCHLGVMATLPDPISAESLGKHLSSYFQPVENRYHVVLPQKKISRIAFLPGQGHKNIQEAISLNADCFITGTSDEPIWHIASEHSIAFLSFGHHATERKGVQKLGEYLQNRYDLKHVFYDEPNPF